MDLQELRAELTKRGISFASNAGQASLQKKLDDAIAVESGTGTGQGTDGSEATETVGDADVGKPSSADAVPAASPATAPVVPVADPVSLSWLQPDDVSWRVQAGLTLEQAQEVSRRQAEQDAKLKG